MVSLVSAGSAASLLAEAASASFESAASSEEEDEPWCPSSAADSSRTGAGLSGSSWPFCGTSIQRTTSLLEYVWIALKTSWSVSSGRVPTETGNFWKKPGSMPLPSAVQVTLVTASVIFLPCISSGLSRVSLVTSAFQPGTGCGITEASG